MKVLVIGATGNFGLRLIPALLAHGHHVVAFVRTASKLESLLPEPLHRQLAAVVTGSAKDSDAIKKAILDTNCDAVINTAGLSAVAPWSHTDLPEIFRSVVNGIKDAGEKKGKPLRAWFLGGQGVLKYPGSEYMLSQ
jgi:nucleoside-diphosphate-sugar epimerase